MNRRALLLALACLAARPLAAADAVTVDTTGKAVFAATVSGPNLLGTAVPVAITTTYDIGAVLGANAAGRMFQISGTTSDYVITLPSAAVVGAGAVLAFSVAPAVLPASHVPQFTIQPSAGQTLDGRANLILIHTNYLEVISVGGQWVSRVKKVDTDWITNTSEVFDITQTGGTPTLTKGTSRVESISWRRTGDSLQAKYAYRQTSAGSAGNGAYLFRLPNGLAADTAKVSPNSTIVQSVGRIGCGSAIALNGVNADEGVGTAYLYDNARFAIWLVEPNGDSTLGSTMDTLANATVKYTADIQVPILNW